MESKNNQSQKTVSTFLLLTLALSSIFYFLIIYTGKLGSGSGLYVTGLMWCPGLSAIITLKLHKRNLTELGWQWSSSRYIKWSYLLPILYVLVSYLIIWGFGWGHFYNIEYVKNIGNDFGFPDLPAWLTLTLFFILNGVYGMVRSSARALGEEIGWRGFLTPELCKKYGFARTSFIVGVIWSLWHYPILMFADYNSGTPVWFGLSLFTIMVISLSFIYTWFRIKSKSLWPNVFLHATHNLYIQAFFTPVTSDTGNTKYFIDEFGAVLPIVCLCIAIYFWTKRSELMTGSPAIS